MNLSNVIHGMWAITGGTLEEIQNIYAMHLRGEIANIPAIEAKIGKPLSNNNRTIMSVQAGVAVIEIQGVIAQKMNLMNDISGGTSSQMVSAVFQQALNDPNVKGIIFNVDSPGGTVAGTFELASEVYQARGSKPLVAFTDGMIASAAYAVASACDAIYISGDTNPIGSIGVASGHRDYSGAEAKQGVKTTEITAGAFKRVSSQYEPLTADGRAEIQAKVDYLYAGFVDTVARNRGTSKSRVLSSMADGRVFLGKQAITNGLVDGISTLPKIIADMQTPDTRNKMMKRRATVAQAPAMTVQPAISKAAFNTILTMKGIAPPRDEAAERAITQAAEQTERAAAAEQIAKGGGVQWN